MASSRTNRFTASRFMQQDLRGYSPLLTPKKVIWMFVLLSIILIPIGLASLIASRNVVEIVDQYETECIPQFWRKDMVKYIQSAENKTCERKLTVPKLMKQPIYVYYQLHNFLQNHRRYVNNRSDKQLLFPNKENVTNSCTDKTAFIDPVSNIIVPCGLVAWSIFNDSYTLLRNNQPLNVNKGGISWKSDREGRFGNKVFPKNFHNGTLNSSKPLSEQEALMVWMRPAPFSTVRKLYGKIEVDLKAGDVLTVVIQNNYNVYSFKGKKSIVLSTTSWLGGKNNAIGIVYLTFGGICFVLATFFTILYLVKPRKLGDPSLLSWNKKRP